VCRPSRVDFTLVVLPRRNSSILLDNHAHSTTHAAHVCRRALTDQSSLLGGVPVMLEAAIAISALMVLASVLWLRPWFDDYSHPYD